jgi:hypothetical protein
VSRRLYIGDVTLELTDAQVDYLRAQLEVTSTDEWVDAATAAKRLKVSPEFMREHATEYGGQKTSSGPKAHWRFPADLSRTPTPTVKASSRPKATRRARPSRREGLLEIRGKSPYDRKDKSAPSGAMNATEGLDSRRS